MLCGRVYGDQFQWLVALCDELMLCSRGDDNDVAGFDFLVFACDGREAAAGCEEEDLVDEMDLWDVRTFLDFSYGESDSIDIPHHQSPHPRELP
jgi:hypothetical protein